LLNRTNVIFFNVVIERKTSHNIRMNFVEVRLL
jgi:hypothetical protein